MQVHLKDCYFFCEMIDKIMIPILLFCLWPLVSIGQTREGAKVTVPDAVIKRLFDLVLEGQIRTEAHVLPGQTKVRSKGSYKSVIKLNRFGDTYQTAQRWAINIDDLNSFVPMWITIVLLEAYQYGRAPKPADEQIISSLEFCNGFMDPNKTYNSSLMVFWPYVYDDNHQMSLPRPAAYVDFMNLVKTLPYNTVPISHLRDKANLELLLQALNGVTRIITGNDFSNDLLIKIIQQFEMLDISADADDTFTWVSLGSALKMLGNGFSRSSDTWIHNNPNISSVFDALKKFAYRPFSTIPLSNIIDPGSYFVLRNFLNEAKAMDNDVAIATTWFINAEERLSRARKNLIHKIINVIDVEVCANVINGITASVLSGLIVPEALQDQELLQIYHNTSALLAYLISSNFTGRLDLALPYYPSRYQLYWTVARTVHLMDIYKRRQKFPVHVMEFVFNRLKTALEGEATKFVLTNSKTTDDGTTYFDDFLGNGDTDDNQTVARGEDRIFNTAMAANFLMYTWLSFDSDSGFSYWKVHTPEKVKEIVDGCIKWLLTTVFKGKFKPWNVFFTMQNKGMDVLPFRYPANVFIEKPQPYPFLLVTSLQVSVAVQGYIPKNIYESMIDMNHFGKPTPKVFKGYSHPDFRDMVFWSSETYTYAVTLLALSRYGQIKDTRGSLYTSSASTEETTMSEL